MKKIENGTIEVILFEEFDLDRYVEEGNFVEKVTEGTVNKRMASFSVVTMALLSALRLLYRRIISSQSRRENL